ncbi:MAG: GldM family protein, partial [Bacteroidota bacterium]|nr:GldM family protein [Bacteroidota bacterium]
VKTTKNFSLKNDDIYNEFNLAAETNPTKAGPWKEKAFSIKSKSDSIVQMIQNLKFSLVMLAENKVTLEGENLDTDGKPQPLKDITFNDLTDSQKSKNIINIKKKKDRLAAGNFLVKEPNGQILVDNLESFRDYSLSLIEDDFLKNAISETLSFEVEKVDVGAKKSDQTWLERNFFDMPLVAAVTLLSKVQTDVRNTESDVISYLKQEIDAGSLKFTSADAIQIANSNYVFLGDSFKADVFLAAKDTTQNPVIYVGDYEVDEDGKYRMVGSYDSIPVVSGKGKFAVKATSEGYKKWGGLISMRTDAGTKTYPFNGEYQVAKTSLVVSPTKMNVFYILASFPLKDNALGNPIDVSVPGIPKDKLSVSCNNGTVKKVGGGWEVFPKKPGTAKISVTAEIDGKRKNMGSLEYRVMRTPKPEPKFLGQINNKVKKSQLLSGNAKLYAQLENFIFDIKYTITSFSVDVNQRGYQVTKYAKGNKVTDEMKTAFESLQVGSVIYFNNISCKGPDGAPKSLPSIKLTIN